jgi:hypothetical protein
MSKFNMETSPLVKNTFKGKRYEKEKVPFNGVPSGYTYTGGPIITRDKDNELVMTQTDQPAITGGRWATTVEEGAELGPELLVAGAFKTNVNISSAGGSLFDFAEALNGAQVYQEVVTAGKTYQTTYRVVSCSAGAFSVIIGGTNLGSSKNTPGTYVETGVAGSTNNKVGVRANSTTTGQVEFISVREVIPIFKVEDTKGYDYLPSTIIRTKKVYNNYLDQYDPGNNSKVGDVVALEVPDGALWMECVGTSDDGSVSYITDYFNGFNHVDYTYTGGPTTVVDNTGTLVTSPAGVLPITGMRNTENGWVDYTLDMASIYTTDSDFIGVMYDTATDTWERVGASRGEAVGQLPTGFMSHQIFNKLRRVVLKDDGTVYKGISWADFTKHDDGTDVDLTGGNGQIMMEYLPAYYLSVVDGTKYGILLSEQALPGFHLHPVFQDSSAVYLGAYEASLVPGQTKLSSIALDPRDGTSPVWPVTTRSGDWGHTKLTTEATDTLAEARGAGWQQADFMTRHWERLLLLVAFAGWNFQSMVGKGRTALTDGGWVNDINIGRCGLGDATGGYHSAVQQGTTLGYLTDYAQVLGIENTYGNVWDRVASLVSDYAVYYKTKPPFNYASISGWTRLLNAVGAGLLLPTSNGFGGKPHSGLGIVLPADVTGSSSTKMTDYFYQAAGLRVFRVGGYASYGSSAGPFSWYASSAASNAAAYIGGRLVYKGGA